MARRLAIARRFPISRRGKSSIRCSRSIWTPRARRRSSSAPGIPRARPNCWARRSNRGLPAFSANEIGCPAMVKVKTPRWGWALTGSGHFFKECLGLIRDLEHVDLFVSRAASEVLRMYKQQFALPATARIFRDTTASSPPVGQFYYGGYHTLVVAPATSNTVAKCVFGISDTLTTNVFAQAGKCRVPTVVFARDTAPELETEAPKGLVKVYRAALTSPIRNCSKGLKRPSSPKRSTNSSQRSRVGGRSWPAMQYLTRDDRTHSVLDRPSRAAAAGAGAGSGPTAGL